MASATPPKTPNVKQSFAGFTPPEMWKAICSTVNALGATTVPFMARPATDKRGGTHTSADEAFIAGGSRFLLNPFAPTLLYPAAGGGGYANETILAYDHATRLKATLPATVEAANFTYAADETRTTVPLDDGLFAVFAAAIDPAEGPRYRSIMAAAPPAPTADAAADPFASYDASALVSATPAHGAARRPATPIRPVAQNLSAILGTEAMRSISRMRGIIVSAPTDLGAALLEHTTKLTDELCENSLQDLHAAAAKIDFGPDADVAPDTAALAAEEGAPATPPNDAATRAFATRITTALVEHYIPSLIATDAAHTRALITFARDTIAYDSTAPPTSGRDAPNGKRDDKAAANSALVESTFENERKGFRQLIAAGATDLQDHWVLRTPATTAVHNSVQQECLLQYAANTASYAAVAESITAAAPDHVTVLAQTHARQLAMDYKPSALELVHVLPPYSVVMIFAYVAAYTTKKQRIDHAHFMRLLTKTSVPVISNVPDVGAQLDALNETIGAIGHDVELDYPCIISALLDSHPDFEEYDKNCCPDLFAIVREMRDDEVSAAPTVWDLTHLHKFRAALNKHTRMAASRAQRMAAIQQKSTDDQRNATAINSMTPTPAPAPPILPAPVPPTPMTPPAATTRKTAMVNTYDAWTASGACLNSLRPANNAKAAGCNTPTCPLFHLDRSNLSPANNAAYLNQATQLLARTDHQFGFAIDPDVANALQPYINFNSMNVYMRRKNPSLPAYDANGQPTDRIATSRPTDGGGGGGRTPRQKRQTAATTSQPALLPPPLGPPGPPPGTAPTAPTAPVAAAMPTATAAAAATATGAQTLETMRAAGKPDDVTTMVASMIQSRDRPEVFTKQVNGCVTEDQKRHMIDSALAGNWN
jgi:hypothetical protein